MRKGIVMECGENYIIVMTPDGEFRRISGNGLSCGVGDEIALNDRRRFFPIALRMPSPRRRLVSAAALIAVLLACVLVFESGPAQAVAYVTVDINPSLEVGISADERVVEVRGLDEEGSALARLVDYRNLTLEQFAAELFVRIRQSSGFDLASATILVTGTVVDESVPLDSYELAEKVKRQIETLAESAIAESRAPAAAEASVSSAAQNAAVMAANRAAVSVMVLSAPKEVRQAAIASGVSTGKLAVGLLAGRERKRIAVEEIKTKSVGQLLTEYGGAERIIPADRAAVGRELIDLLGKLQIESVANRDDGGPARAAGAFRDNANKAGGAEKENGKNGKGGEGGERGPAPGKPENAKSAQNGAVKGAAWNRDNGKGNGSGSQSAMFGSREKGQAREKAAAETEAGKRENKKSGENGNGKNGGQKDGNEKDGEQGTDRAGQRNKENAKSGGSGKVPADGGSANRESGVNEGGRKDIHDRAGVKNGSKGEAGKRNQAGKDDRDNGKASGDNGGGKKPNNGNNQKNGENQKENGNKRGESKEKPVIGKNSGNSGGKNESDRDGKTWRSGMTGSR